MATTQFIIDLRAPSDKLAGDLGRAVRLVEGFSSTLRDVGKQATGFAAAQIGLDSLGAAFDAAKASIIDFSVTLDKAQLSFKFLMGSSDEAKAHIGELLRVAQDTPFPDKEFLDSSRILQGLGANAAAIPNVLKQIANAATVAQVPLTTATEAIARFLSNVSAGGGNLGQGARQLQSQGLISDTLKAQIQALEEQGASAQQIIATFLASLGRFDGAAKEAASSWEGLIVNIRRSVGDAVGVSFQPFFRLFETLGQALLKAINTDEAKKSFLDFGTFLFDTTEKIVTGLVELWKPFSGIFQGFIDQQRKLNELIQHQADAQEALKRGMTVKDFIFSGPADIQKFLQANPIQGPVNQNSLIEKTRAAFRAAREAVEADATAAAASASATGGTLFKDLGPTEAQKQALEEAHRIFQSLSPDIDETGRKVLDLKTRFDALAKGAGANSAEIRLLGEQAVQLAEVVGRTNFIDKFINDFAVLLPGIDPVIRQLEALRIKTQDLAKAAPEGILRNAVKVLGQETADAIVQFELLKGTVADVQQKLDEMDAGAAAALQNELKINAAFKERDDLVKDLAASLIAISIATNATRGTGLQGIGPTVSEQTAGAVTSQITSLAQVIANANRAMADLDPESESWQRLSNLIDETSAEINHLSFELQDVNRANVGEKLAGDFDLIGKQAQAFGGAFDAVGARISSTENAINALIRQGVELTDLEVQGLISTLDHLRSVQKIVEATGFIIESSLSTISDTLIDAFANGTAAAIKWGDVVTQVLKDIAKELFRVLVIQTLVSAAKGALGGLGGGVEIGGLDAGGIVTRPGIFALAEGGRPEAVIPLDRLGSTSQPQPIEITVIDMRKDGGEVETKDTSTGNRRQFEIMIKDSVRRGLTSGEFDRVLGQFFGVNRQAAGR